MNTLKRIKGGKTSGFGGYEMELLKYGGVIRMVVEDIQCMEVGTG